MKYRVGDTVRISKKSHLYGRSDCNPRDADGKIVTVDDEDYTVRVNWDNGTRQWYHEEDLKLRRRG